MADLDTDLLSVFTTSVFSVFTYW